MWPKFSLCDILMQFDICIRRRIYVAVVSSLCFYFSNNCLRVVGWLTEVTKHRFRFQDMALWIAYYYQRIWSTVKWQLINSWTRISFYHCGHFRSPLLRVFPPFLDYTQPSSLYRQLTLEFNAEWLLFQLIANASIFPAFNKFSITIEFALPICIVKCQWVWLNPFSVSERSLYYVHKLIIGLENVGLKLQKIALIGIFIRKSKSRALPAIPVMQKYTLF